MNPEVIGIGEVLIDFVSTEPVPYTEASYFKKCFGGAPMNTLVGVARLDLSAGAVTVVGDDPFGQFLINELKKNGVDTSRVSVKKGVRTTITFVANEPVSGERSFIFYRRPWVRGTSDSALTAQDVDHEYISKAKILHVSGFALSQNPSRKAILSAVRHAKKSGVRISFDPTLRVDVWNSETSLRRMYHQMLRLSDIATFSREEAEFILKTSNPKEAAEKALRYGAEIVGVKLGSEGAFLKGKGGIEVSAPAFRVKAVDTTGAGDGWNAGLLLGLCNGWKPETCVKIANAVGALVVTKHGAITALPYKNELNQFLKEQNVNLQV